VAIVEIIPLMRMKRASKKLDNLNDEKDTVGISDGTPLRRRLNNNSGKTA